MTDKTLQARVAELEAQRWESASHLTSAREQVERQHREIVYLKQELVTMSDYLKEAMELLRRTKEDGWKCADQVDAFFARVKP